MRPQSAEGSALLPNRYPQIQYYDLFISIRIFDQTYCAEYSTPVLDEIDDLFASNGEDIEVTLKKKGLIARIPKRYKIKAYLVDLKQCSMPNTAVQRVLPPPAFLKKSPPSEASSDLATNTSCVAQRRTSSPVRPQKPSAVQSVEAGTVISDPIIRGYVNRLVQNIAYASGLQLPFTVEVVESEEINASVRAGRYLDVNTGLILASDSEAELAGTLAHEIAHLTARHNAKIQKRQTIWPTASLCTCPVGLPVEIVGLLSSRKSHRDAEREADWLGLKYQDAASYDPQAFLNFLEKTQTKEEQDYTVLGKAFATHPSITERIRRAQSEIFTQLKPQAQYIVDTSEFQQIKSRLATLRTRPTEFDEERLSVHKLSRTGVQRH